MNEGTQQYWLERRQRARTDLLFLCNTVLKYPDICEAIHGPIIRMLQPFPGGQERIVGPINIEYTPYTDMWHLPGDRNFLVLDPRGFMKTTLVTIAHAIQWIINFPDVRILYSTGIGAQSLKITKECISHFRYNDMFRWLFPEFCPPSNRVSEFGTQDGFTVPNRRRFQTKENTLNVCTVGTAIAGGHYDVIIHSDLVDKENVKTANQIREVKDHYKYTNPLLERSKIAPHHGWVYVEGTRYDFSDVYGDILDTIEAGAAGWRVSVREANNDNFTELLWPDRYPQVELQKTLDELGPWIYSCQYRQRSIPTSGGLASKDEIKFIPHTLVKQLQLRLHCTIDLHGMEEGGKKNDYTVFTVAGFDRDGRVYIVDGYRGRYTPFEVIDLIFTLYAQYPKIFDFKIEKDAHARVLLPFFRRECEKRQKWPIVVPLKRDNATSKKMRIKGLQPWFKGSVIRFADDVGYKSELIQEVTRFSDTSSYHDDILDTLADQMFNRDAGAVSDVVPDAEKLYKKEYPGQAWFLGFEVRTGRELWTDDGKLPFYDSVTGL